MHINIYEFKKKHTNGRYSDSEDIDLIKNNYVGVKINVMQLNKHSIQVEKNSLYQLRLGDPVFQL